MDTLTVTATLLDYTPDLPADKALPDAPIIEVHDRALLNVAAWADGGRNWWRAYSYLQGNSSAVVLLKQAPGGPAVAVATVAPPSGFKIDSATATQNGDGPDIIVTMTVHQAISDPARAVQLADAVVPGLAVPRTAEARDGLAAPFAPGPPPEPTPGSDPQAVADAVVRTLGSDVTFHTLLQRYAKNGAREAIAAEVQNEGGALQWANAATFLRTPDGLLSTLKDGLYQWMRDRLWETLIQFLTPKAAEK